MVSVPYNFASCLNYGINLENQKADRQKSQNEAHIWHESRVPN